MVIGCVLILIPQHMKLLQTQTQKDNDTINIARDYGVCLCLLKSLTERMIERLIERLIAFER